ncbi:hypothetical protein [Methylosinus sporium]|uniref:hypothetical protein n=1 Tax=Methylosinus sporium TaxID=428 RepID=UPI001AEEA154|nr:hypothetical protein [Methylosinus sporium]
MALGAIAALIQRQVAGAMSSGGASVLVAALCGLGIPEDSILDCEQTLRADGFLVFVHGRGAESTRAHAILAGLKPTRLEVHASLLARAGSGHVVHVAA